MTTYWDDLYSTGSTLVNRLYLPHYLRVPGTLITNATNGTYNSIYLPSMLCNSATYSTIPEYFTNSLTTTSTTTSSVYNNPIIIGNTVIWPSWHDEVVCPTLIQERIEAENARLEELRRVETERYEQRKLSTEKANQILLEHLTPDQREMVEKNGWFVIEGGKTGKIYRIGSKSIAGNVEELDEKGKVIAKYCCHLPHQYPQSDHLLTQKLMLEWDEEEFLRKANKSNVA